MSDDVPPTAAPHDPAATRPGDPTRPAPAAGDTATTPETREEPRSTGGKGRQGRDKSHDPLRGSRTSGLWAGVVALGVVLVLLIVFIAQNTTPVQVAFLGWEGRTPLSVALLIATAAGLFLATVAGMLRILQLRRRVRRERR